MDKRTLEQAFETVFHKKESFSDFCSIELNNEVEEFKVNSRKIYRTSDRLKKYLRFIDRVVFKELDVNSNVVHSYVRGRSALTAVKEHAGQTYFFLTDIKEFFQNITADDVRTVLTRNSEISPISDIGEYIDRIVEMVCWEGSIPIGFPTSPKLSNSFLLDFDSELHSYCTRNELIYTRYSDDVIISAKSMGFFNNISSTVQSFLNENASDKLKLNTNKTRITHIGNKVKILGLIITPDGRVTIDSKYKKIIESLLHFYINDKAKFDDLLSKTMHGKERSLFGMLHYAKSIDFEYVDKLQRKYGAYALSSLMEDKWSD